MSGRNFYDNESLESSDSDSDSDYREVLYSSSSIDRSSIGSIPWAEDAIKQNQLDWERVERMFYNEEDLPIEQELRNEIIDWQKRFPHLRIIGNRIKENNIKDDKLKLEWPISERLKQQDSHINKFSAKSLKPLTIKSGATKDNHNNLFSEDLRISSVSIVARKNTGINQKQNAINRERFINFGLQTPLSPTKASRYYIPSKTESLLLTTRPKEKYDISIAKLSNSASFVRMPPIINNNKQRSVFLEPMKFVLTSSPSARSITANHRTFRSEESQNATRSGVNRNTIILPALDMDQINLNSLPIVRTNSNLTTTNQTVRSISAAYNHRQINNSYIPFSASNLKISK